MKTKKISFSWEEKSSFDTERVGAMYCFKRCDVNQNENSQREALVACARVSLFIFRYFMSRFDTL